MRTVYNAILYVQKTGCQWRMLPGDFPPWKAVYANFMRHRDRGTFEKINDFLVAKARVAKGRKPKPTAAIIDSQSVKTVQKGRQRGYDAGKKNQRSQTAYNR